jgi:hypothetical protein
LNRFSWEIGVASIFLPQRSLLENKNGVQQYVFMLSKISKDSIIPRAGRLSTWQNWIAATAYREDKRLIFFPENEANGL